MNERIRELAEQAATLLLQLSFLGLNLIQNMCLCRQMNSPTRYYERAY